MGLFSKNSTVPEVGKGIKWNQIVDHVFQIKMLDDNGTKIDSEGNVKARNMFVPYGYLTVTSPILNQWVLLPIVHRDDFLLASSIYSSPEIIEQIRAGEIEVLVTYIPKIKTSSGFSGNTHANHYAIVPKGTLEKYYSFNSDIHMSKPQPEKIFTNIAWSGDLRIDVNDTPDLY